MTLAKVLGIDGILGIIALIIGGVFWFASTVCILCIMEVRAAIKACLNRLIDMVLKGTIGLLTCAPSSLGGVHEQTL